MAPAKVIYCDYNATTPVDPRVVDKMVPYFTQRPGNAASRHHFYGWQAEEAVRQARAELAQTLGIEARELVFTSGATESCNLALKGVFEAYRKKGGHIITVKTEHKAVLDACERIEKMGGEVTYLDVDEKGDIDLTALEAAIRDDTILVAVMWANNETGLVHPMETMGEICARKGTLLFSDATQAVGKIPVSPAEAGVHLLACSAHKMYGPKGVGALYLSRRRPRVVVHPLLDGGGHEQGFRSGTLNVPAIVGFGEAVRIAREEMQEEHTRLARLRDQLEQGLLEAIEALYINGNIERRLPHVSNVSIRFVDGEQLMMSFKDRIAVSSGAACTSGSLDPSHVLSAMGMPDELAHASVRLSLGRFTEAADIPILLEAIKKGVDQIRSINPVWMMYKDGVNLE